jgi:hypothetical protein
VADHEASSGADGVCVRREQLASVFMDSHPSVKAVCRIRPHVTPWLHCSAGSPAFVCASPEAAQAGSSLSSSRPGASCGSPEFGWCLDHPAPAALQIDRRARPEESTVALVALPDDRTFQMHR